MGQMPSVLNQNLSQQLPFQNPIEEVANINNVEHDYPRPLYDIINVVIHPSFVLTTTDIRHRIPMTSAS